MGSAERSLDPDLQIRKSTSNGTTPTAKLIVTFGLRLALSCCRNVRYAVDRVGSVYGVSVEQPVYSQSNSTPPTPSRLSTRSVTPLTKSVMVSGEARASGKPEEDDPPVDGELIHPPKEMMDVTF